MQDPRLKISIMELGLARTSLEVMGSYKSQEDICVDTLGPLGDAFRRYMHKLEEVRGLIEASEKISKPFPDGSTPIHIAVIYGDVQVVQALLNKGVRAEDILAEDSQGRSAWSQVFYPKSFDINKYEMMQILSNALPPETFPADAWLYDLPGGWCERVCEYFRIYLGIESLDSDGGDARYTIPITIIGDDDGGDDT